MDDYPAGPASPGARRAPFSVVIPVRNGKGDLERCLRALGDSSTPPAELIVVDDGSTDDSAQRAKDLGALVIRHDRPRGPAAARNTGAQAATAPIVFFLDADVSLHANALARATRRFAENPTLAGLFGSYDDQPAAPGLVSRFRNLLHHHMHQSGAFHDDARPAHTFWTGCGAIRRDVFEAMGGFDPQLYRRPAIEDIELGYRLHRAGHLVLLDRSLQATHLKQWTLTEMIRTDIFRRGIPWMLLILRSGMAESDLNVSPGQRACVASTALAGLGLVMSVLLQTPIYLAITLLCLGFNVLANLKFYRFLHSRLGLVQTLGSVPLHALYYACCGLSVLLAGLIWYGGRLSRLTAKRMHGRGTNRARPHQARTTLSRPHAISADPRRWWQRRASSPSLRQSNRND